MTAATLKAVVTHNFGLKMLSLGVAFGLWYSIASEPEVATIVSVPIDYKNFPKDLVISSKTVDSISVEARGPASRLREMQESRVAAVIDFSSVSAPGERTFNLTGSQIRPPRGVILVRAIPEQLRFQFEHQIKGKMPVEVEYSGALPRGVTLGRVTVSPPELEIMGPESRVLAASKPRTDPFDLSRITEENVAEQELSVYIADPELRFADSSRVRVKIRLERNR